MGSPTDDILREFEARRSEGASLFQSNRDRDAQRRWVGEQVESLGAKVHLIITSTERNPQGNLQSAGVDPLYGDILDPQFIDQEEFGQRKFNIGALIDHKPSKQLLRKFGIDEQREIIFHFPFHILQEKGLVSKVRFRGVDIGDLIVWDGTWYIVDNSHRMDYFGLTNSPFFTGAFCSRYRGNTVPTEDTPKVCN